MVFKSIGFRDSSRPVKPTCRSAFWDPKSFQINDDGNRKKNVFHIFHRSWYIMPHIIPSNFSKQQCKHFRTVKLLYSLMNSFVVSSSSSSSSSPSSSHGSTVAKPHRYLETILSCRHSSRCHTFRAPSCPAPCRIDKGRKKSILS